MVTRAIQRAPHDLMSVVVDEGKHHSVDKRLGHKGGAWRERQQNARGQKEKQHRGEERHHRVKHLLVILLHPKMCVPVSLKIMSVPRDDSERGG